MNYKQKWELLKEWFEEAMEEGYNCGYDKEQGTVESGMFYAYKRMLQRIKELDGDVNASN